MHEAKAEPHVIKAEDFSRKRKGKRQYLNEAMTKEFIKIFWEKSFGFIHARLTISKILSTRGIIFMCILNVLLMFQEFG